MRRLGMGLALGLAVAAAMNAPMVVAQDLTLEQVQAAYRAGDLETARQGLMPLAEAGNPRAQYQLGYMIANGEGGPAERAAAIRWLEAALGQGHNAGWVLLARLYLSGAPEASDIARAAELLQGPAQNGDADALFYLGNLMRSGAVDAVAAEAGTGDGTGDGTGSETAGPDAFTLLRQSAGAGNIDAQFAVAQMYSRGEGVGQDAAQASRWLLQSAEGGHAEAQLSLYFNYSRGAGFPQDDAVALAWLTSAAEAGNPLAQRMLGAALLTGQGVAGVQAAPEQSIAWLKAAAEAGEPGALSNLGYAYATGTGVAQDMVQAAGYYQAAADKGLIRAAVVMGDLYRAGNGVEQDMQAAVRHYLIGAEGRSPLSRQRLGDMVISGAIDPADYPERVSIWAVAALEAGNEQAQGWLMARADAGDALAAFGLGRAMTQGADAAEQGPVLDPGAAEQGAAYLVLAAQGGVAQAQALLSDLYATGTGVPQDFIEAHKWANVAATNGVDAAVAQRDTLSDLMTADQIAEAQARARAVLRAQ